MAVEPTRTQRHEQTPEVLFLGSSHRARGLPSASVCVVCGHPQSELVALAREAVRRGDAAGLSRVSSSTAGRPDLHEPIVEVSYHGTSIVKGVLAEGGLCRLLPFAGGALDPREFATSTYVASGTGAPAVATLVIVCEPSLSDLERRALDRLPQEGRLAVGGQIDAGTTVARLLAIRAELMLAGRLS